MEVRLFEGWGGRFGSDDAPEFDFTLFVGPASCFHHNRLALGDRTRAAALCPDDAQIALGQTEELVLQAVGEILGGAPPDRPIESLRLVTACQSAFSGLDGAALASDVAQTCGIVCVHRETARIARLSAGASSGAVSEAAQLCALADAFAHGAPAPEGARAGEGLAPGGVAILAGGTPLDKENELFSAARAWGFPWALEYAAWRSPAALAQMRTARFSLALTERGRETARLLERRWGIPWEFAPATYRLSEIDERIRALDGRFGARFDARAARDRACEALRQALQAWEGRALDLDLRGAQRPWNAACALLDYGFDVRVVRVGWTLPGDAHPDSLEAADYRELLERHSSIEQRIVRDEPPQPKRQGAPRARGAGRRLPARPSAAQPAVREREAWGYFALAQLMRALTAAARACEGDAR